jgi:oxygen-dependent protoporphyrinogen oxidase
MSHTSALILGGGISGLALARFLKVKYGPSLAVKLIEKEPRLGGWVQSVRKEGFLFEQGPRSCRTQGNGKETLQLIKELNLEDEVIACDPAAERRFLWKDQKLQPLRSCFLSFSQILLLIRSLRKDLFAPKSSAADESIDAFVRRRLGKDVAESMIDPLVSGIYAGDSTKLSIRSCFPLLYEWEQKHGSLIKAFWANWKLKNKEKKQYSLFSFKMGMETLIHGLERDFLRRGGEIVVSTKVTGLSFTQQGVKVEIERVGKKQALESDYLFSALPAQKIASLLPKSHHSLINHLNSIPSASVIAINFGYRKQVLKKSGFGYLIPSKEKEQILGVVWDSSVLPQQNGDRNETRLTVMMGGEHHPDLIKLSDSEWIAIALEALKRQLGIEEKPDAIAVKVAAEAIPQYYVGHQERLHQIEAESRKISQRFFLLGSSFYGVSLNDCIARANFVANSFNFSAG